MLLFATVAFTLRIYHLVNFANDISEVTEGIYPNLLQYDKRWGYGIYGNDVIAVEGCGPTALAAVIAGLTGRNDITPYDIAEYAHKNGYYDGGTSWNLFTKGVTHFGIKGSELSLSENSIKLKIYGHLGQHKTTNTLILSLYEILQYFTGEKAPYKQNTTSVSENSFTEVLNLIICVF